jgi:hypothetical protein
LIQGAASRKSGGVEVNGVKAMKLIQPKCRVQFAAEDIDFVVSVLGQKIGTAECLVRLLADEESRDLILDDETLLHALLDRRGCLRVTTRFYFYILVRHVFRRAGIDERIVADYVSEVLAEFARSEHMRCALRGEVVALDYVFEMLAALVKADDADRFLLRLHIGNYSLFLSGVFPARIRFRAESRGFPSLRYYEEIGRSQYRAASDHPLAQRYEINAVLGTLADRFETTRLALNDIAERLFSLGDANSGIDALLKGAAGAEN